ncbi:DNA methylase [Mycobacterium phage Toaka]|nr:DNA methylase [Mycobacterium phage Toaka]
MKPVHELKIGSLFSGAGGLDLAVERAFYARTIWQSEVNKAAATVLAKRFGVPNLGDITQIDWHTVPGVDILCGGFPCQDVSHAGLKAGIESGTRSGLWSYFAEAIDVLRPSYVVIENVRGLLSAKATGPQGVSMRAMGRVLGDLSDLGYDASWKTLAAASVGAPHKRERVFILAQPADALSA